VNDRSVNVNYQAILTFVEVRASAVVTQFEQFLFKALTRQRTPKRCTKGVALKAFEDLEASEKA